MPDAQNRIDTGLNSLLVRTGDKNILIETGIGNKLPEKMAQIYKQPAKLLENLHAAGVAPEDIDIVINTHLHFDHCGWNTVRRGDRFVATFRKRSTTHSGKNGSMAACNSSATPSAT